MDNPYNTLENSELWREVKEAMTKSHEEGAAKIMEHLDRQKNTPLNIAITGESGAGKSTFVNAFRGIAYNDEGAAPTGPTETTSEVTPYPHPQYQNVIYWDLPGIGTTNFPADKYLELVKFERFDFFIIISDVRFRENDVKLAQEIQRMKKKFYFVRSKIDNDVREEQKKRISKEETLSKVRNNCTECLQKEGFASPKVFLVSSSEPLLYDFSDLGKTLESQLPQHKRDALLMAMPNISLELINKKKETFRARIEYFSVLSVIISSSVCVDELIKEYQVGFGLDCESLQKLADRIKLPLSDLESVMKSSLADHEKAKALFVDILSLSTRAAAGAMEDEKWSFTSFLGIVGSVAVSCLATYNSTIRLLDIFADDAQRVFTKALEHMRAMA